MNLKLSAFVVCLAALPVHAEGVRELCGHQAVGVVAELRSQQYPDMTQRELGIARDAAITACVDAHAHAPAAAAAPQASAAGATGGGAVKNWFGGFLQGSDVEEDLKRRRSMLGK